FDARELRRAIVDRYGSTPPLGRAADMTRIVAEALRARGYLAASIAVRPELAHAPDRATLVFHVDPRPRTAIGAVEIVGRATVSRDELIRRLGVRPGAPFEREAIGARIDRYVEDRKAAGYYEARIVPEVRLADDGRTANVTL